MELAIAVPVLMMVTVGVAEYGHAYASSIKVSNAVKTAAQYGVQNAATTTDTSFINQAGRDDAGTAGLDTIKSAQFCKCPDGTTPSCTGTCGSFGAPEVFIRVRGRKTVRFLIKYPGFADSLIMIDTAVFRLQ